MTKGSSERGETDRTSREFDAPAALAIKIFLIVIFTAGAIVAVLATVDLVFDVWSTIDQSLGAGTTTAK